MFAKVEVNGDGAAPLYQFLREAAPEPDGSTAITWNFAKFLVDAEGNVVKRYSPKTTPEEIEADLAAALGG
jgi:glutathione peroxidase